MLTQRYVTFRAKFMTHYVSLNVSIMKRCVVCSAIGSPPLVPLAPAPVAYYIKGRAKAEEVFQLVKCHIDALALNSSIICKKYVNMTHPIFIIG